MSTILDELKNKGGSGDTIAEAIKNLELTPPGPSPAGGMIVHYTQSSGAWQSDKTLDEILEALSNGINVFAITPNAIKLDVEYVDFTSKNVVFSKVAFSMSGGIEDYEVINFDAVMIDHGASGITYSNGTWTAPESV